MASPWKWFGVKTVVRDHLVGKPERRDADYDSRLTLVEERVVLVRARNHAEAQRKALAEAKVYVAGWHLNRYGQRVYHRQLKLSESYELYDPPADLVEVWSTMSIVPVSTSDKKLEASHFGSPDGPTYQRKVKNFLLARRVPVASRKRGA